MFRETISIIRYLKENLDPIRIRLDISTKHFNMRKVLLSALKASKFY